MGDIIDKQQTKGNLLKVVVLRVDYEDIIQIKNKTIMGIRDIFRQGKFVYRMLEPTDFVDNDPINMRMIPEEIIRETKCYGIIVDNKLVIEFNQFFLRVTRYVRSHADYAGFQEEVLEKFSKSYNILNENEEIRGIKVYLKKVDETFFKSLKQADENIKSSIMHLGIMSKKDISFKDNYKYATTNNFQYKNSDVNLVTRFERVIHRDKPYYRLFTDIENYRNIEGIEMLSEENILKLNTDSYELFKMILTPKALKSLDKGEQVGYYELN